MTSGEPSADEQGYFDFDSSMAFGGANPQGEPHASADEETLSAEAPEDLRHEVLNSLHNILMKVKMAEEHLESGASSSTYENLREIEEGIGELQYLLEQLTGLANSDSSASENPQ